MEAGCAPVTAPLLRSCECSWDDGGSVWDAGLVSWECDAAAPDAAFLTYAAPGGDERLARVAGEWQFDWSIEGFFPWRLIAGDGYVAVVSDWKKPSLYDAATGALLWEYTPPSHFADYFGGFESNDAALDGLGGAYVAMQGDEETGIYHVNAAGIGSHLYTASPAAFGSAMSTVASIALSGDRKVLYAVVIDQVDNGPVHLLGVSAVTGAVLWDIVILAAIDGGRTFAGLRRVPESEALIVTLPAFTAPMNLERVMVQRLDFSASTASAPTITWEKFVTGADEECGNRALEVTKDGLLVGYAASAYGGGTHVATKLDLDGGVQWRLSSHPSHMVALNSMAVLGDRAVLGIWGNDEFPDTGVGYLLVDWVTGERVQAGVFPLAASNATAATASHNEPRLVARKRWAEAYIQFTRASFAEDEWQVLRLDGDSIHVAHDGQADMSWRSVAHPAGWVDVMNGYGSYAYPPGVRMRDFDGAPLWGWQHEDGEDFTMDAAVAADGSIYVVTTVNGMGAESGFDIHRLNPLTGAGQRLARVWPDDLPTPAHNGSPLIEGTSIALSRDNSVAYVLVSGETSWHAPGIQTLVGIDLATGALLWQHLLERERPGYYYGTYNFYDSYDVRSVPGEDTCYVTYEAFVTDNEWRSQSLGRMEFPAGPRQAPTQAWTRLPFSVTETDEFSQWNGQRALVVTSDAVLIGVEQGFDTPAPARLILKYDHAGELLWTWGEDEQVGENAAITANGLAVAAGVVFFSLDWGNATPLFPTESTGFGALDYETGEFVSLDHFPFETRWGGPVAARGGYLEPDESCAPAVTPAWCPPAATEASGACPPAPLPPCGDECVEAWDAGRSLWDGGATAWPCPPPPPPGLFLVDYQPLGATEYRMAWIDGDGLVLSEAEVPGERYESLATAEHATCVIHDSVLDRHGLARYARDGSEVWRWLRPDPAFSLSPLPSRLMADSQGGTYSLNRRDSDWQVWYVDAGGVGRLVATVPYAAGGYNAQSAVLSHDESVLYVVADADAWPSPRIPKLTAVGVADGALLFAVEVAAPAGWNPSSFPEPDVALVTDADAVVVCFSVYNPTVDANSYALVRLDFTAGVSAPPAPTWARVLYNEGYYAGGTKHLVSAGDALVLAHPVFGSAPNKPEGINVTCLAASDGSVRWASNAAPDVAGSRPNVAISGERLLVRVFDSARFPGNWPLGYGYVLLDLADGRELVTGVFPLAAANWHSHAGVALASGESPDDIESM